MRFVLAPVIGLALVAGAAPAWASGYSSHCGKGTTLSSTRGQSGEHQVAGSGTGRRIR